LPGIAARWTAPDLRAGADCRLAGTVRPGKRRAGRAGMDMITGLT